MFTQNNRVTGGPRGVAAPTQENPMQTRVDEIANGIFRLSTFVPEVSPAGFAFNQFLVLGDEPLLFHTGPRRMFPLVRGAVDRIVPAARLRWISFGHVEADECGSMNEWLALAPHAQVAHGDTAVSVSLNDLADRAPRLLGNGEVIDLGGGKRVRYLDTPHTPHAWESGIMYEESTGTLLCGDLFTQVGNGPALTEADIVGPAMVAEDLFQYSSLNPGMGTTIRALADLAPRTLAVMHGSSYAGDGAAALRALADEYDRLALARLERPARAAAA
jgi:flavorubredoxin